MGELGVIGATYEDRRNGRIGTLISRDEKCKTLMFEAPGGKNFITSYSGFRSNMRKKEVSTEISNDVPENVPTEESQEQPEKQTKRSKVTNHPFETATAMFVDMTDKFVKYAESFNNKRVKVMSKPEKRMLALSLEKGCNIFNVFIVYRGYQFKAFIKEDVYRNTPWTVDILSVYNHISYTKPICVYVSYNQLEQFLEDLRPVVVDALVKRSKRRNMKEEL